MEIQVTVKSLKEVVKKLGDNSHVVGISLWRYSNKKPKDVVEISLDTMSLDNLILLQGVMKENDEEDIRKLSKLINSLKDPANKPVQALKDFPRMLTEYLEQSGRPLLHSLDAELRGVAYLPMRCRFFERERNSEAYVSFTLGFNTKMQYSSYNVVIYARDLRATVPEILRKNNLMVPDESMSEDYQKIVAKFELYGGMDGEQFWMRGKAPTFASVGDDDDDYWWRRETIELTYLNEPTKGVLDIEAATKSGRYSNKYYATLVSELFDDAKPQVVPLHPVLPLYSLAHHKTVWVNVVNLKKYKYEENLRDRLVLPNSHSNLIGALVSNLDAMKMEDLSEDKSRTIRAKASSSIILAKGPAGTGKTLTAEVYAEEIKRPLYEVQTGQLGTTPEDIEKNLKRILNRAIRLRMPLLINEADVFVRARGDDLTQTAIVSIFLRLLEYHTGLVFLTTNKADDIDDAIVSRCIAVIKYELPKAAERLRLWQILLKEFNTKLANSDVRKAVLLFPEVTGRDIQNIIRLTNRVCVALEQPFTLQALRDNAVFKDVKVLTDAQLAEEIERRKPAS